jgi:hypothetical protein
VWIATANDIANWWRARSQLETSARMTGANRLEITLRNRGVTGARGAVIRIAQPSALRVLSATGGKLLPGDEGVTRVLVPFIAGRDSRTITVGLGR